MEKQPVKSTSTLVMACFVIYMLLLQAVLPNWAKLDLAYRYRIKYDFILNETSNLDVILEQIAAQIKREKLQDYVIILGDSVAYSGPGPSSQSLAYYMQDIARQKGLPDLRVYNLAAPAMQTGDIYTMLLKLERHGISTDHLIINLIYAGFVKRQPDPPAVFWLQKDLQQLDPETYQTVLPQLQANGNKKEENLPDQVHNYLVSHLNIYRYRYFLRQDLTNHYYLACHMPLPSDALGDARPWTEKPELDKLLQQREYKKGFAVQAFDMSEKNPQIFFLSKIIARQKHKQTLVFLAGINDVLLKQQVSQPGYIKNLELIDHYFAGKGVSYLNLQGKIDDTFFSDHVHLTADGYRKLSGILLDNYLKSSGHD
ncbi:MAG: hypothetical protein ABFD18_14850 [Syntrophomonas sp.]